MRERTRKWILMLFIIVGLLVVNYPFLSQYVNQRYQDRVISAYEKTSNELSDTIKETMRAEAESYNLELFWADSMVMKDAFAGNDNMGDSYAGLLSVDASGIMGYVHIPKIKIKLPIYHGTSARVLEAGAGHLEGSSLPVGGENTHVIISAHNGLPSKLMFTDLDQLETGDCFFLEVLEEKMAYEVDQIKVIEPEDTSELRIVEGKDYVTLVTCTPYGINSHRYLVRGHRIEWEEEDSVPVRSAGGKWEIGKKICVISLGVIVISGLILFLPKRKKRKENQS